MPRGRTNPFDEIVIREDLAPENVKPVIPFRKMEVGDSIYLSSKRLSLHIDHLRYLVNTWGSQTGDDDRYYGYRLERGPDGEDGLRVWRLPADRYHVPIESHHPIPEDLNTKGRAFAGKLPVTRMQIGESIFIPEGWQGRRLRTMRGFLAELLKSRCPDWHFVRRVVDFPRKGMRLWRVMEPESCEPITHIDHDIPPPTLKAGRPIYTLTPRDRLQVGQSFFIPFGWNGMTKQLIERLVYSWNKREAPRRFKSSFDETGTRIWRIKDLDAPITEIQENTDEGP